jgi:hypothetical protein
LVAYRRRLITWQPNKKARLNHGGSKPVKKQKAFERPVIPIPAIKDNSDMSDEDLEFFQENQGAGQFLQNLDSAAIARYKHIRLKGS